MAEYSPSPSAAPTSPDRKIAGYHHELPASQIVSATMTSSNTAAQASASRRGRMVATVYKAMSRARPLAVW